MYLDQAKIRYQELRDLGYSQPVPCTLEEIEELENWVGHRLPQAYREFLLWMGHSGGGLLRGSDCFYSHLKDIQNWAKELLKEDEFPGTLPEQTFVFFMHQGYQFNFFHLGEGDDPPVYWYIEEEPVRTVFAELYPCYSDFLLTEINGHIKIKKEIRAMQEKRREM